MEKVIQGKKASFFIRWLQRCQSIPGGVCITFWESRLNLITKRHSFIIHYFLLYVIHFKCGVNSWDEVRIVKSQTKSWILIFMSQSSVNVLVMKVLQERLLDMFPVYSGSQTNYFFFTYKADRGAWKYFLPVEMNFTLEQCQFFHDGFQTCPKRWTRPCFPDPEGTIVLMYFSTKFIVHIIHEIEISDLARTAPDIFRCRWSRDGCDEEIWWC